MRVAAKLAWRISKAMLRRRVGENMIAMNASFLLRKQILAKAAAHQRVWRSRN
jgi:hypothetical protein